jgi:hypothetical protein
VKTYRSGAYKARFYFWREKHRGALAPLRRGELHQTVSIMLGSNNNAPAIAFCHSLITVQAFVPPSTVRLAPVIYDASGPATKATNAATSSACP